MDTKKIMNKVGEFIADNGKVILLGATGLIGILIGACEKRDQEKMTREAVEEYMRKQNEEDTELEEDEEIEEIDSEEEDGSEDEET